MQGRSGCAGTPGGRSRSCALRLREPLQARFDVLVLLHLALGGRRIPRQQERLAGTEEGRCLLDVLGAPVTLRPDEGGVADSAVYELLRRMPLADARLASLPR